MLLFVMPVVLTGCGTIEYQPDWIDSPTTRDASFSDPTCRVSARPPVADLDTPVIIAVHGFTASTWERDGFRACAEGKNAALISLVLLGRHGTDVSDFAKSAWQECQKPMIRSSCPTDKNLYMIDLLSVFIAKVPYQEATDEENRPSCVNRLSATLVQLKKLVRKVEDGALKGYTLTAGVGLTVYRTKVDEAASPANAPFLRDHIRAGNGGQPEIHMIDSDKHVFTRLQGRATVAENGRELQNKTFEEVLVNVKKQHNRYS